LIEGDERPVSEPVGELFSWTLQIAEPPMLDAVDAAAGNDPDDVSP
jgi:hypothetical protein